MTSRRLTFLFLVLFSSQVTAQNRPLPHHLMNPGGHLTPPSSLQPRAVADGFLRQFASRAQLSETDLAAMEVVKEYRTAHNGVTHILYRPSFQGLPVYNAEFSVNVDRDGGILNAGGRLVRGPATGVLPAPNNSVMKAVRSAAIAVNKTLGDRFAPFQTAPADSANRKPARFAPVGFGADIEAEPVWYATESGLTPAWLVYVVDSDGISAYDVVIDAATQNTLAKEILTWFDTPQGMVFDHSSPQPYPVPGTVGSIVPPLITRTVQSFAGDPAASPSGWVSNGQTSGNNVSVGLNRLGLSFVAPLVTTSATGDFTFPLQLGITSPNPDNFADAAATNLFYWTNRAHDWYYSLGFDEVAGNYQQNNFGHGGVDGDALLVYSQFGSAGQGSAALNNSFYSTRRSGEDGAAAMLGIYLGITRPSGLFTDGAYDPEVVVHEYTHGVSTRLIHQLGSTFHGGAMGEAFSDFLSLEFTIPAGSPADGSYTHGSYFFQNFATGIRTHPYSTKMSINPLTFANFGRVSGYPEVHSDGEIWAEALFEVRAAMIEQFGEQEGRRRIRLMLIDAMKLAPPAPSMVEMRDSILMAESVDFGGASQNQIWNAFAKRGLGVLARAATGAAIHIKSSTQAPSSRAQVSFYDDPFTSTEPVRIAVYDPDATQDNVKVRVTTSYGDAEDVFLDRDGQIFTGSLATTESFTAVTQGNSVLELVPGETISASYAGKGQSTQSTAVAQPRYSGFLSPSTFTFQNEKALNVKGTGLIIAQTLPFPFPFFDQTYNTVYLHSNGILAFTGPLSISCNDSADLQQHAGIAPLWIGLSTAGTAQDAEDVYVSSTSDSVTYRFAGEVASVVGNIEPVNFSTTLFKDGRIEFHYGSGNHNLLTTTCGNTPVVGIANGHETFVQLSGHSGLTDLSSATTVTDYPPFGATSSPKGTLEMPAPNDHVQNRFPVSGVRYDSDILSRVDLLIDGKSVSHTPSSAARTDFCATNDVNGCPNIGYVFPVTASSLGLTAGNHTAQIRVLNVRGNATMIPDQPVPFVLDPFTPAAPVGQIDTPTDGAAITATTTIRGYAYSPDLRVLGADVLVDGITYGAAVYGQSRTDICSTLPTGTLGCPGIGFTFSLNPKSTTLPIAAGNHTLAVRVRDELGNFTSIPSTPLTITVR